MRKLISVPIIFSSLIVSHFQSEAQLLDTISKNHYYGKEVFYDQYLDIYNSWMLRDISGGLSGEGYDADFDKMIIDSIGIFKIYRNDSLFICGKITIVDQTDEQLEVTFDADTVSGGIFFDDMHKYIWIRNDTLMLTAPCCDRYNYLFTRGNHIVHIPDTAFLHALIDEGVDTNGDSLISSAEAELVRSLDVSGRYLCWDIYCGYCHSVETGIVNLKGIEAFKNLDSLDCSGNSIESLDLSNNRSLLKLNCAANQISYLYISHCTVLTTLDCSSNQLIYLDLSNNTALKELYAYRNPINSLDIANCTSLEWLTICGSSNLYEVCVWTIPFPPEGVHVDNLYNKNVCFETDCDGECSTTGIRDLSLTGFSIYPNPTHNILTFETDKSNRYAIKITSPSGQLLYNDRMEGPTHQIDLSSFDKGIYFITVRSRDYARTEKIIKQ